MINVTIHTLSNPPEMDLEDTFYNKVACYIPEMAICDFIQIDVKGVKSGFAYPAQIEFVSSAKKQTIKCVAIDLDKAKPFKIVVEGK